MSCAAVRILLLQKTTSEVYQMSRLDINKIKLANNPFLNDVLLQLKERKNIEPTHSTPSAVRRARTHTNRPITADTLIESMRWVPTATGRRAPAQVQGWRTHAQPLSESLAWQTLAWTPTTVHLRRVQ
ncbi:jg24201 [Pararge aegeria aegeria]|uniref:Jg24201 protein n=1 Tax=Pararge aegeria aegeria TaxID=348720 RepID=A0A8S4R2G3_9NEOP|nr:jg24201 [Pararge aegeria aegeria]